MKLGLDRLSVSTFDKATLHRARGLGLGLEVTSMLDMRAAIHPSTCVIGLAYWAGASAMYTCTTTTALRTNTGR